MRLEVGIGAPADSPVEAGQGLEDIGTSLDRSAVGGRGEDDQAGSPPCSMKSRSIFGSGWSLMAASKAWSRL